MKVLKVLVAEDNVAQAESLGVVLSAAGHVPLLASGGEQAISQVEVHGCDAAIIDLLMPGIGGRQLLAYLRGKKATAEIPVVISTGLPISDERLDNLNDPHLTLLQKPYDLGSLGKALGIKL